MELGNGRFFSIPRSWTFSKKVLWCWATSMGLTVCTSFFSSSMSLLSLARLFWNHVITWALLRPNCAAISSLSAGLKYFWYRNRFSSSKICWLVKAVRLLRFFFGCWRLLNRFRWLACSVTEKNRMVSYINSLYFMCTSVILWNCEKIFFFPTIVSIIDTQIDHYVTSQTQNLFLRFEIDDKFLKLDPSIWSNVSDQKGLKIQLKGSNLVKIF